MIRKIVQLIIAVSAFRLTCGLNGPPQTTARRNHLFSSLLKPSALIDNNGFLKKCFFRQQGDWEKEHRSLTIYETDRLCTIRLVPGDGNCLFHAISLSQYYSMHGVHYDVSSSLDKLYEFSRKLCAEAVSCVRRNDRFLFVQGGSSLLAIDLVSDAAEQYGVTPEE
jgi:hypothetical protein